MQDRKLWKLAAEVVQPVGVNIPGCPLIEIMGNDRILVENHRGLIGYHNGEICIKTKSFMIRITGRDLGVSKMTDQDLVVHGTIEAVQFLEGDA